VAVTTYTVPQQDHAGLYI